MSADSPDGKAGSNPSRRIARACTSVVLDQRRDAAGIGAHEQRRLTTFLVLIPGELVGLVWLYEETAAQSGCAILDGRSSVTIPRNACQQSHAISECGAHVHRTGMSSPLSGLLLAACHDLRQTTASILML